MPEHSARDNWQLFVGFAEEAYNATNFAVAETLIRLALEEAQSFGLSDPSYLSTLEHLGEILSATGRFEESIETYSTCKEYQTLMQGRNSLHAARLNCKIAASCVALGEYAKGEVLYLDALKTFASSPNKASNYTAFVTEKLAEIEALKKQIKGSNRFKSSTTIQMKPSSPEYSQQRTRNLRIPALSPQDQTTESIPITMTVKDSSSKHPKNQVPTKNSNQSD